MPHSSAEGSFLAQPLRSLTRFVLRAPGTFLTIAVLLALVAILVTVRGLEFKTSRLDLLNPASEYNQRWLEYLDEFGDRDDAVVVVRGPNVDVVTSAIDAVAERLRAETAHVDSVFDRIDLGEIYARGMHFLPISDVRRIERFIDQYEPVLVGRWSVTTGTGQLERAVQQLAAAAESNPAEGDSAPDQMTELASHISRISDSLSTALQTPGGYRSIAPPPADPPLPNVNYLLDDDGRLGFVMFKIRRGEEQFAPGSAAIQNVRRILREVQADRSTVRLGLTGLPVMEFDEMQSSQSDMVMASLISLVGVAVLFIAGFGGFRYPLMTVAALILAMTWSFAYITLAVGHLNILSVSFGAIVIGLGIDFGIHYVARYMQLRESSAESEAALIETASTVGPGIVTGGVTTSLAFFTAALTEFTGISELGVVAGGGIALCILSALIVLPSMIILADRKRESRVAPNTLPLAELCAPAMKTPLRTLLIGGVATAALVTAASGLRYDHNLLNLQPVRLESVKWERLLLARTDRSVWFALSIAADPQQLLERKAAFESLPTVERTEEIVSLLPTADPDRTDAIARIHNRLGRLPQQAPVVPAAGSLPERTNAAVSSLQRMLPMNAMTKPALDSLLQLQRHLQATAPNDAAERLFDHQQHAAAELLDRFQHLARVSRPEPPSAADVDPALAERFVGRRQQHLLKVFARGDVWDMHALERFVSDLESIDPGVTGHPVQTYYASRHMQQSYIHAALYAFLAISIVLMLDFRSIRHSLLAMTPMALGLAQMAGLLALLDIPLNAANMIVLPLILGIGIDDGVHVVHDYRRRRGVYQISGSTAAAIVVTSATTMLGFGSMMFAKHQGLRSLGQVLTLGVFCCLVSSLFLLPALLSKLGPGSDSAESER